MLQDLFGKVKKRAAVEGKKKTSDMDVPQNLLFQCPKCRAVMLMDEFEENGKVCRKCGHHARLTAWERIRLTADPGSFRELDGSLMACDPIGFEDYPRKLENTRRATGKPLRHRGDGQPVYDGLHGFGRRGADHPRL